MDFEAVLLDLEARISAAKQWFSSGKDLSFDGPSLRNTPTKVLVADFLDTAGRVERHGLAFVVECASARRTLKFQVNVRVKPTLTEGPKGDSNAYVAVYVVNQARKAEELISVEHFKTQKHYEKLSRLSTKQWFENWLSIAFRAGSAKLLSAEVQMERMV